MTCKQTWITQQLVTDIAIKFKPPDSNWVGLLSISWHSWLKLLYTITRYPLPSTVITDKQNLIPLFPSFLIISFVTLAPESGILVLFPQTCQTWSCFRTFALVIPSVWLFFTPSFTYISLLYQVLQTLLTTFPVAILPLFLGDRTPVLFGGTNMPSSIKLLSFPTSPATKGENT